MLTENRNTLMEDLIMSNEVNDNKGYGELLQNLKSEIQQARMKAHLAVNKEMITLYWKIGNQILERQKEEGWGSKVIENISKDLRKEFPEMKGLSYQNISYMRQFAIEYNKITFLQQAIGEIPWGHNITIFSKIKDQTQRIWYANKSIEHGWSRNILAHQIELGLFEREGKAISNYSCALPSMQSDLAHQLLKDPYKFDFLSLGTEAHEREIEKELVKHIEKFLLELGAGFAFVGKQYQIQVADDSYYIDLLFYHLKLRSYVVIELKAGQFKPEYTGKLNFYLSAVDDILRHPDDNASIGILLCKDKGDKIKAEYALRDMNKPIGLAEYKIGQSLPKNIRTALPTIQEIEDELSKELPQLEHNTKPEKINVK